MEEKKICSDCGSEFNKQSRGSKCHACLSKTIKIIICTVCGVECEKKGNSNKCFPCGKEYKKKISENKIEKEAFECSKCNKSYLKWSDREDKICIDCASQKEYKILNKDEKEICSCTSCGNKFEIWNKSIRKCRDCDRKYKREYYERNREKMRASVNKIQEKKLKDLIDKSKNNTLSNKQCNMCLNDKPETEFRINSNKCKDCSRAAGRKYRQEHKEKNKEWVQNNRERMTELQKDWFQNRKNEKDPEFIILRTFRCRIFPLVLEPSEYLGDIKLVIKWLEFCFLDDINWDNHGEWHIDHVIPISKVSLNNEDEIRFIFNWKNISPLKGSDNLIKRDNIVPEQMQKHLVKLQEFFLLNKLDLNELVAYQIKLTSILISVCKIA